MDICDVIELCKLNLSVTIPQLQVKFGVTYKQAKDAVDELVADNELVYDCGIKYKYIGEIGDECRKTGCEGLERQFMERCAALEERGRLRRIFPDIYNDDDDDDDDDEEGTKSIDGLHYKALKLCIEKDAASPALLHRELAISYFRACELIDWMAGQGYISAGVGAKNIKVLITMDELNRIFNDDD